MRKDGGESDGVARGEAAGQRGGPVSNHGSSVSAGNGSDGASEHGDVRGVTDLEQGVRDAAAGSRSAEDGGLAVRGVCKDGGIHADEGGCAGECVGRRPAGCEQRGGGVGGCGGMEEGCSRRG